MEKLEEMRFSTCGAVLRYGAQILVVGREFRGFHAAVYEMIETPEETGFADIERRRQAMKFPSREQIAALRRMYLAGTMVELISMEDAQAPPPRTLGEVQGVDDAGQILVHWQTGSSLNLLPGVDIFRILREEELL